ncbi:MAG: zf-TFIIB domain-containing protein [Candidatus Omnitrophica bacterium]|nr:zf-TFIIB domain-containing protein [Candidatus Omnitrophota bacterium]
MNCPACKDPMVVLELDEVELDHCMDCGGVWLDEGELELLLEGSERARVFLSFGAEDLKSREKKRRCPICRMRMRKVAHGVDRKVLVDRCPRLHGLWCDRGELGELMVGGGLGDTRTTGQFLQKVFAAQDTVRGGEGP